MPKILNFRAVIQQDEDGIFIANVPAIPGCHTQGDTYEEAVKNIEEAIAVCLDEAKENKNYRNNIDWPKDKTDNRFFGVIDVSIRKPTFA